MTIKEFYEWAVKNKCEDREMGIDYSCEDDWYNYEGAINDEMLPVEIPDSKDAPIVIRIENLR